MNRLDEILQTKRIEIERLRAQAAELAERARKRKEFRDFRGALMRTDERLAVIAEIKKASPSAGLIARSFDPVTIAQNYEHAGAAAISILTDEQFFQGALDHLVEVRPAVTLPVLRKDFILDEIQVAESSAAGADAILLIVAALAQTDLVDLFAAAATYHLDVLMEVHTRNELDRALDLGAKIIGINNRDLATIGVDLSVTEELCKHVPDDVVLVSESGIKTAEDVSLLRGCGVDAILVGEAMMRGEISIEELQR